MATPAGSDSRSSEERRSAHAREAEPRPSDGIDKPGPSTSFGRRVAPSKAGADPCGALVRLIEAHRERAPDLIDLRGAGAYWMRVRGLQGACASFSWQGRSLRVRPNRRRSGRALSLPAR